MVSEDEPGYGTVGSSPSLAAARGRQEKCRL